jgi:hypothetical protein
VESERCGQRRQVQGGVGPQRHQRERRGQPEVHGRQPRVTREEVGQERQGGEQGATGPASGAAAPSGQPRAV